jgi:type IV pilus assembly protein PilQ
VTAEAAPAEEAVAEEAPAAEFAEEDPFAEEEFAEEELAEEPLQEDNSLSDALAEEEPLADDQALEDELAAEEPEALLEDAGPSDAPAVDITAIEFVQNEDGGSVVVTTPDKASFTTRYNAETQQYVIEVQNATLRDSLKRPYLMKEFESAFGAINAYQNEGGSTARIVVQMKELGEPVAQQEGNEILLLPSGPVGAKVAEGEAAPKEEEEGEPWEKSYDTKAAREEESVLGARTLDEFLAGNVKFFGRPISIQVSDADIQDVINFVADESGVNIVLSEDVKGKISLKLRQVPWDQALVIVMRAKGLGYVREGNVIRITQLKTLQEEAKAAKEIVDAQSKLTPLRVKVIPVSYATVTELIPQIQPFLTQERGRIVADSRTSSVVITDTANVLARVERLVKELDLPPTQVMIEGKIVEAAESWSRTLGVNWGFSGISTELSSGGGFQGNPINLAASYNSTSIAQGTAEGLNSFLNLSVGTVDFFGNLTATLGLAQTETMVKIISSPRIVTMNRAQAEISQAGEVISVRTQVDQQGTTTASEVRTAVNLRLNVTPQITAEGSVILKVEVERQFAGAIQEDTTQARPINTRRARTEVLVPNGQTAVIGGIYQNDETYTERGVPFLKEIPVLGWLFKSNQQDRNKNELLIFLTPRILNPEEQKATES